MHEDAHKYVFYTFHNWRESNNKHNLSILEIGSLNVNGTVRDILFPHAKFYLGIDVINGLDVDLVVGGDVFMSPNSFDLIVCCEVFEHTTSWRKIIENSYINLKTGGAFISTMAGKNRPSHSVSGAPGPAPESEYYQNILHDELEHELMNNAFKVLDISSCISGNIVDADLRCFAIKI